MSTENELVDGSYGNGLLFMSIFVVAVQSAIYFVVKLLLKCLNLYFSERADVGCATAKIVGKLVGLFSLSLFGFIVLFTFRSVWLLLLLLEHLKSWFLFSETVSSIVEMTLLISCNNDSCNLTSFRKFTVAIALQSDVHVERVRYRERKRTNYWTRIIIAIVWMYSNARARTLVRSFVRIDSILTSKQ